MYFLKRPEGIAPLPSEITPRAVYAQRRSVLGRLALAGSAVAARALAPRLERTPIPAPPQGVVLLEGMAARTPVVASDLEAYRITTRDGSDAALFATGDVEQLARTLMETLERGPAVEERIERGWERAVEHSMQRLARAYVLRYERILPSG